jgi:hypothetical protein
MDQGLSREEALQEYEKLRTMPLEHPKPRLQVHPFINAVYEPERGPSPVVEPNPTYRRMLQEMHPTDWLYVAGGVAVMATVAQHRPLRLYKYVFSATLALPGFLGLAMFNSYARLVGLKSMDSL